MKNKNPWTMRRAHFWVGTILALPFLLMALSGIFISMRSVTNIKVPLSWSGAEKVPERLPVMAYLEISNEIAWIGNAQGLHKVSNGNAEEVTHFSGQEIMFLAALPNKPLPLVATRMAVWSPTSNGEWKPLIRGRVRQLSSLPDGRVLAIAGGRGEMADGKPMATFDGMHWEPYMPVMKANRDLPALENPKIALHQWMRELHSGAYFWGKGVGEMIWSNILGWVLAILVLTGLWMWIKTLKRNG
ncbi:PepSY domain-containing protein [Polynucleobacter sp. MWH-HuK1]|uniref:PepSY domain-containing protein n=1 Tax=Polynucleobacter sp. MWH-HuK1 TaxID=1743158 RepID=UPI001C0CDF65|nr:PepSY domain-containing protein [Polynucleobacter sp. MWH-HuK1]MBU3565616.1 PepSY domain-containing protein [Polynucleobacter sp. MWH-HuK1]